MGEPKVNMKKMVKNIELSPLHQVEASIVAENWSILDSEIKTTFLTDTHEKATVTKIHTVCKNFRCYCILQNSANL